MLVLPRTTPGGTSCRPPASMALANSINRLMFVLWAVALLCPLPWRLRVSLLTATVIFILSKTLQWLRASGRKNNGPAQARHEAKGEHIETLPTSNSDYAAAAQDCLQPAPCAGLVRPDSTPLQATAVKHAVLADSSASPSCPLVHATAASTATSGRSSNIVDSGQSAAVPGAVVDSILAVTALRRSHLTYHSVPRASAVVGPAAVAGQPRRTQLYVKLPGVDPEDLPAGFLGTVNDSLRLQGSTALLVGAAVRRGCIELTLDFLERGPAGPPDLNTAVSGLQSARLQHHAGAVAAELDIPSIVLSALGVTAGYGEGPAGAVSKVLVQRGGLCYDLEWDPAAMRWQVRGVESVERGVAATARAATRVLPGGAAAWTLDAPLVVHAPEQLDAGRGGLLRLAILARGGLGVDLRPECFLAKEDIGNTGPDAQPSQDQPPSRIPQLQLTAKANGRTTAVRVLAAVPRSDSCLPADTEPATAFSCSRIPTFAPSVTTATASLPGKSGAEVDLALELDLGYLAAGRPASSQGLVVRLELWRNSHMLASVPIACLRDAAAVAEMAELQADVVAAGELDPEDDGYMSAPQQRAETQELLGDLGAWLDFVACVRVSATGEVDDQQRQPKGAPELGNEGFGSGGGGRRQGSLDLSRDVGELLAHPTVRPVLLGAGQHLLEYFICHGLVALARGVHADWQPLAEALQPSAEGRGGEAQEAQELTLLHRAVRSGSPAMVQQVMQWAGADTADSADAAAAAAAPWAARGPGGVTPLHLLAADARCGAAGPAPSAAVGVAVAAAATAEAHWPYALGVDAVTATPADMAEALLRWVMSTYPAAVTVWNTARDASGNTPAMLWAALGGQDIQVAAAATALAQAVGTASADPPTSNSLVRAVSAAGDTTEPTAAGTSIAATLRTRSTQHGSRGSHEHSADSGSGEYDYPGLDQAAGAERAAEARLLSAPMTKLQMLRLAAAGFPTPSLERRYLDYVTLTTSASTLIWLVIMVIAHLTVVFKGPVPAEGRQALVGGASYLVSLLLMVLRPRTYAAWREGLMLCCLLGRSLCRLLMVLLPDVLHMSESVQKYIVFGLDVLLDGFMEGTFEQVRLRRAVFARLVEWPITSVFIWYIRIRPTLGSALLRGAAVSATGLLMSALTDVRMRTGFLRDLRMRAAVLSKKAS